MYGTSDVIVPPDSIRDFYGKMNNEDKKLYSFDGYYHEIFNEVGKEAVYKVLFPGFRQGSLKECQSKQ